MELTFLFPVLLLCSFSAAELQPDSENEIIPGGEQSEHQGRRSANVSSQGATCPQDIHAVLREMSSLLAAQTVELRHLQRENQAQAANLRELEVQDAQLKQQVQGEFTSIQAKANATESQVEALRKDTEAQAMKLKGLDVQKTELSKLKQQVQAHAGELVSVQAKTNVTEDQVEALRRDTEVRQVAFSASLLASGGGHLGPFNAFTTLVFRHVITNSGNAYNPNSGFFTAPVRGAYHFEFYIGAGGSGSASAATLVKNGQRIVITYEHQPSHHGSAANGATLLLDVADVVFLQLWPNTRIFDNENHHSTFSGHLLFTT